MLQFARGCTAIVIIALNTFFWCVPIYVLGLIRLIIPSTEGRALIAGPMDRAVDGWVSVNRMLIKLLNIVSIEALSTLPVLDRKNWYVIMSNHQSWADILILQVSLRKLTPPVKFYTKRELIWAPLIGLAMWFLGFPYVRRGKPNQPSPDRGDLHDLNKEAMLKASSRFLDRPVAVLSFLEGTRFTSAKHKRTGSPFKHLLKPRVGGFAFALTQLEEVQPKVLDITLLYEGSVPNFWEFLCGRCRKVRMEVQEVASVPAESEDLRQWVDSHWQEKDDRIASLRELTAAT